MVVNDILKRFKSEYPSLKIHAIYETDGGYIVSAPETKEDYNDPFYLVSSDLQTVEAFPMKQKDRLFEAFRTGPIWTEED